MNPKTKSTAFYFASSFLLTLGISFPAEAHFSWDFHQHEQEDSSNVSSFTIPTNATEASNTLEITADGDTPVVLPDVDRPGFWLFSDNAEFVEIGDNTDGQLAIFDFTTLPGGPLPHYHTLEDEFVYVLDGEITYQLEDQLFTATPGTFISKPKNVLHAFVNAGERPARHIEFVIPAGIDGLFEGLGQPGTSDNPPIPQLPTPELIEGGFQLLSDFGVVAPDSLLITPPQFGITQEGDPELVVIRPGEADGKASATLIVSNPEDDSTVAEIPVTFGDGERIQNVEITGIEGAENQNFELTLVDPIDTSIALLQNKALLTLGEDNTYTLLDGYSPDDFPLLLPDPNPNSFWLGGSNYTQVANVDQTEGLLSLFDVFIPEQNSGLEELLIAPTDLALYTLDGEVTINVADQSFSADPNTFIYLPQGSQYTFSNFGQFSARTLLFTADNPSKLEDFVMTFGTLDDQDNVNIPEPSLISGLLLMACSAGALLNKNRKSSNENINCRFKLIG
ncbi:cupin domain-containing protein [Moorena sp. SIO3H5]|uniref:cupin domain-containing protein n=1 Tax=Moorena sp. SIO3H5 TaxID=2607834 RepID=UPI0013BD4E6F|nr:cupin domain-containing protein [Moorena sp. SIO3H5]NEO73767.1 cupin domain-containing protein [Moorena sp. SIO3H5]